MLNSANNTTSIVTDHAIQGQIKAAFDSLAKSMMPPLAEKNNMHFTATHIAASSMATRAHRLPMDSSMKKAETL